MPGMLETYLNVGLNPVVAAGLAEQPGRDWAAWDAYRRLMQFWGMSCGLRRGQFGDLLAAAKQRYGVAKKAQLSGPACARWRWRTGSCYRSGCGVGRRPLRSS